MLSLCFLKAAADLAWLVPAGGATSTLLVDFALGGRDCGSLGCRAVLEGLTEVRGGDMRSACMREVSMSGDTFSLHNAVLSSSEPLLLQQQQSL